MNTDLIESLLGRLSSGDETAVAEAYVACEPYLRMVVRRHLGGALRAKFDSADIVQSVWADVLQGFRQRRWRFADAAHLCAFLRTAMRNRFLNRLRRHRRALEREQRLPAGYLETLPAPAPDRPSRTVQAEDLWERLLTLCPPAHRELLRLRRQGVPLAELASRSGLHESSIRRIFYDLARQFAESGSPDSIQETAGMQTPSDL